jgi:hypothetical protein
MDGGPLPDINEDQPYPPHFMDAYSESKALAEQAVLGGDDENLRTVVQRVRLDEQHLDQEHPASRRPWLRTSLHGRRGLRARRELLRTRVREALRSSPTGKSGLALGAGEVVPQGAEGHSEFKGPVSFAPHAT